MGTYGYFRQLRDISYTHVEAVELHTSISASIEFVFASIDELFPEITLK